MARDYENIYDPDELSDTELKELVREELASRNAIDADSIVVTVEKGKILLSGRVGTEAERRVADHVLTDVIGIRDFRNEIVVDSIRRDEEPEAIDDHLSQGTSGSGAPLGTGPDDEQGPEAEHLTEDLNARLYGSPDSQQAVQRGTAWIPPESPTSEGLAGTEAEGEVSDEDH